MLTQTIEQELQQICHTIQDLQNQISLLPEGKLICTHSGPYPRWYQSIHHTKSYISQKNRLLAQQLAYKAYLSNQLEQLIHEKKALELYMRHHKDVEHDKNSFLSASADFYKLLRSSIPNVAFSNSDSIQHWLEEPYLSNPFHPEALIHRTLSGILVRSKSESIIASTLFQFGIPFRYECALDLNGHTIYPDFTILHPHTGELYYYEHFGMLDVPDYLHNALSKLRIYAENGIYPTVNLLLSFETRTHPLDSTLLERTLRHYFLPVK